RQVDRRTRCRRAVALPDARHVTEREAAMAYNFHFDPMDLPPEAKALRQEVRGFLRQEIEAGTFTPDSERAPFSVAKTFAKKVGAKGWIGMTWPKEYGGHEGSHLARHGVTVGRLPFRAPSPAPPPA